MSDYRSSDAFTAASLAVVPIKPDLEMMVAAMRASGGTNPSEAFAVWQAMLAAAETPARAPNGDGREARGRRGNHSTSSS